ncbi:DUF4190 domain-containing protein [Glycomyces luteolus]|uniref:DUF4190 domain-containing protein n=1 Tax=Glycomyces luteolus TaxID=2670330 RepID=A0A9X3P7N1_9ACTN|nr:DUF4190 domain-containing protein [Glycomyces luteolus]MDA1358260.1 DUF4190 domain-containing protein [Glycomyces luteolus]
MTTPDPNSQPQGPPPYQPPVPPPYAPYPQPPPYGYPYVPPRPTNGMAIAAMICGIVGVCSPIGILALIFGNIAKRQIRETGDQGDGMATAGIVLGWIGVAATIFWIAYYIFVFVVVGTAVNELENGDWYSDFPTDDPTWAFRLLGGFGRT